MNNIFKCQQLFMAASVAMNLGLMVNNAEGSFPFRRCLNDTNLICTQITEARQIIVKANNEKNALCQKYKNGSISSIEDFKTSIRELLYKTEEKIKDKRDKNPIGEWNADMAVSEDYYYQTVQKKEDACNIMLQSIDTLREIINTPDYLQDKDLLLKKLSFNIQG